MIRDVSSCDLDSQGCNFGGTLVSFFLHLGLLIAYVYMHILTTFLCSSCRGTYNTAAHYAVGRTCHVVKIWFRNDIRTTIYSHSVFFYKRMPE
jgi:hypothetical protein